MSSNIIYALIMPNRYQYDTVENYKYSYSNSYE